MANMTAISEVESRYLRAGWQTALAVRQFLEWMEWVGEHLAPERLPHLVGETRRQHEEPLRAARTALADNPPPPELEPFAERLSEGLRHVEEAFALFSAATEGMASGRGPAAIALILGALHEVARSQEAFYLLRQALPPLAGFWQLDAAAPEDRAPRRGDDGLPATGIIHVSAGGHHGGFSLYVPESYDGDRPWPLIVALHGGSGNGRDFLWTWVREAKSLEYLLVAPSAVNQTWSDIEEQGLLEILAWISFRYRVARSRVLLTGLSDGATFGLLYGLAHPEAFRALAPLSGVLHPANAALGNLERAKGMPIYLVHGAKDFLFPVHLARAARDILSSAGALVEYRELPDLSHTYARSENIRILRWFAALPVTG
jgi:phospholipase/carboxylesterase